MKHCTELPFPVGFEDSFWGSRNRNDPTSSERISDYEQFWDAQEAHRTRGGWGGGDKLSAHCKEKNFHNQVDTEDPSDQSRTESPES